MPEGSQPAWFLNPPVRRPLLSFVRMPTLSLSIQTLVLALLTGCALYAHREAQRFDPHSDGAHPRSGVILSDHTLYGTTSGGAGGFWGLGTVFKLKTDGRGYAVLHHFGPVSYSGPATNSTGAFPEGRLVLSGHTLYGTAPEGDRAGGGTVFKINTVGTGFAVLHGFGGSDGARPLAGLVLSGHTLFGTTQRGGHNAGTVFKVNTDGSDFTTLHTFGKLGGRDLTNSDGAFPQTELVVSGNTLFGTAWPRGAAGRGTVFKVRTDGSGFAVLHHFEKTTNNPLGHDTNRDGAWIESGLVLSGGLLCGAAAQGGPAGNGTVFRLNPEGTEFKVLHSFGAHGGSYPDNTNQDGEHPTGLLRSGDALYGIASDNGSRYWGTLFRVGTDGDGFTVLHSFGGDDGCSPRTSPALSGPTLYGITASGGKRGGGTVFKLHTDGTDFVVLHHFTAKPLPPSLTD